MFGRQPEFVVSLIYYIHIFSKHSTLFVLQDYQHLPVSLYILWLKIFIPSEIFWNLYFSLSQVIHYIYNLRQKKTLKKIQNKRKF